MPEKLKENDFLKEIVRTQFENRGKTLSAGAVIQYR